MAVDQNQREKLVRFLGERAFDPGLPAGPDRYSGEDREKLEYVEDGTQRLRQRHHHSTSAEEVCDRSRAEGGPSAGQRVQRGTTRVPLRAERALENEAEDLSRDPGVGR